VRDTTTVTTPDHIDLELDLAGPGARAGALIIDLFLLNLSIVLLVLTLILVVSVSFDVEEMPVWAIAIFIVLYFLVSWCYFLFFETLLAGQTPGKKLFGLRVLRDDGLPIGLRESVIRNLLRGADMLPPPSYLLGGIAVWATDKGKRLGDMAAGTIVVSERMTLSSKSESDHRVGAQFVARLERGESRHVLSLSTGTLTMQQLDVMVRFRERGATMPELARARLAWKLAAPHLSHFDHEIDEVRAHHNPTAICEAVIDEILALAEARDKGDEPADGEAPPETAGELKSRSWVEMAHRTSTLLRGGRQALTKLSGRELLTLIRAYRGIIADLARVRAMGGDRRTTRFLEELASAGHNLLYGRHRGRYGNPDAPRWPGFARQVRTNLWAVGLASAMFFVPAAITFLTILFRPDLAYDLVTPEFLYFEPASSENLHDIPSATRPLVSTSIMSNNINIALMAFALGLTYGVGTTYILVTNGVFLGAIFGWFTHVGNARALWGWVMPHGGTELMAIVMAGAAGYMLSRPLLVPGNRKRITALTEAAPKSLAVALGSVVMLVIAGLIEGFVSPSTLPFGMRVVFLAASVLFWLGWWLLVDHRRDEPKTEAGPHIRVREMSPGRS